MDSETGSATRGSSRSRTEALIHLLGDEDAGIRSAAWDHLERLGEPVVPAIAAAADASSDPRVRRQARQFLRERRRREALRAWVEIAKRPELDLEEGAFLIARSEYPEADVEASRAVLDEYAGVLKRRIATARSTEGVVDALVGLLTGDLGFRGNEVDFFDPDNSYLHRVIDRKLGIPISLAAVYLCVARRLAIPLEPVGLPLHFLLKFRSRGHGRETDHFIDPFHGGERLSSADCARFLRENGVQFHEGHLRAVSDREMLARMLANLLKIYHAKGDRRRLERVSAMIKLVEG
jgi:regulator of sirC expression with transglutaminase-like and TPR domain